MLKLRYNNLILLGDTHGIWEAYCRLKLTSIRKAVEGNDIVHLGDFGVGFSEYSHTITQLNNLNNFLVSANCRMFVIRGNHDCPSWFAKSPEFSNLFLLPDYSVLQFQCGVEALCVGGAYSIDRFERTEHIDWWKGEITPYQKTNQHYPLLLSHDCPSWAGFPTEDIKTWRGGTPYKANPEIYHNAKENRDVLDKIALDIQPKLLFHGHYHHPEITVERGVRCRCVTINELVEIREETILQLHEQGN